MINTYIERLKTYKNKHPKLTYFICFTFIFLLTVLCFYAVFFINHKSFIWKGETKDGLVQHYNSLMYYGSYLRSIVKNIFIEHQLSIPMWDFSMGYGADILSTLHYYVIGDPLNLLSVFVTPKYTEFLYMFLIILRLYLAGLAFSYYCLFMKKSQKSAIVGSIVYVFCGYIIFAGVRHPYFINPMIYLPLLVVGVEKIFQSQSAKLFIGMIALAAISNFYFFYMLCLLVFVYALIRYFDIYGIKNLKNIPLLLGKFILYAVIGVAMAAFILIPVVAFFLGTARSEYKIAFDQIYSLSYYISGILNFNSYNFSGYWAVCSFSAISILNIFVLYIKKKNNTLKIAFIIMSLFLCIPFVGYAFNGFSYLSNRWIFGYAFIVGIVTCWTFDDLMSLSKKEYLCLGGLYAIYFILAMCFRETRNLNFIISSFIVLVIMALLLMNLINRRKNSSMTRGLVYVSIVFLCIGSVSINAYFKYSPQRLNYIKEYVNLNDGYSIIKNTRAQQIKKLKDKDFFRYDETAFGKTYLTNAALQQKQHSLSFFYSLGSGFTTEYFTEMQNLNALSSIYTGLNYRSYLDALASVKYFVAEAGKKDYAPYGFNSIVYESDDYTILKNDFSLPLGYTYSSQISNETYNSLTALQKQQALLQSVHIDGNTSLPKGELEFADRNTPYKIKSSKGIKKTENGFKVNEKNASIVLTFDGEKDSELYLKLNNLSFVPSKNKKGEYLNQSSISITSNNVSNNINLKNEYHTYYNGTKDFLMNLGYLSESRNEVEIKFNTKGQYTCDSLQIYHLSMSNFQDQIYARSENVLENIQLSSNQVTGDISLDSDKFLCLSIPYSAGWKLFVDGENEELYRANTMYMGTPLKAGKHSIKLVYTTPYIIPGCFISIIGISMFGSVIYFEKKKMKKRN